jgi:hypothetical protein
MSTIARATGLRLSACTLVMTAALATWPLEAGAHEVGTTAVTATVDGRRYTVEVTLDAGALVAKLDAAAGRPRSGRLASEEYRRTLGHRVDEILQHLTILFDGRPSRPALESVSEVATNSTDPRDDSLAAPRVCLRLAGDVPHGVRTFRWSYDLTFASYAFIVKRAGGPVGRVEWLEGGQPSSPFEIGTPTLLPVLDAGVVQLGRAGLVWCALLMLALPLGIRMLRHIRIRRRSVDRRCQSPVELGPGAFNPGGQV